MRKLIFCVLFVAANVAAQDPIAPHSAYEPPAAKDAAALTASTKASPADLLTTSEKTDGETGRYAEVVDLSHRLEHASKYVKVVDFGTTPEGRTMVAMVVSKDRAFTPEAAAKTNKAVILIQSGIHSGEIEGKDTAIMLVRDMIVTKRYAGMARQGDLRGDSGVQRGWPRRLQPISSRRVRMDRSPPGCAKPNKT